MPCKVKSRLVDDLRRLNKVTVDSTGFRYEPLEALFRDGWDSTDLLRLIDWRLGFHHVRLAPGAAGELYFCFLHPRTGDLWYWTRLPMG